MGVICLVCAIAGYYDMDYASFCEKKYLPMLKKSVKWPATPGKIVSHSIFEKKTGRYSHSPRTHYYAEPAYLYTLKGKNIRGVRVCFLPANCNNGTSHDDAQALLNSYPVGSTTPVCYDPKNPGISTLRRGDSSSIKQMNDEISSARRSGILFFILTVVAAFITYKTAREFRN